MSADPLAIPPIPAATASLAPASPGEVAESLAYALRFDERGRPRSGGWEFAAAIAAERLVEHLERAGFVVLKRRTGAPHSAG
ncbi:hypothetical protein KPL78_04130 [Roseomonas sp. HJA6]|uniref:Uncharacterized protein n=1 Tax=Roseomonas alba TaxID=2846776 RepID=A0ABS7A4I7_9PROT|nr:hypothetical protein [Neoroseomonas alba]MBW6397020.1 hypothetical protein [Neoroseomonas alba]